MYTVVLHKHFNRENFGVYIGKDVPKGFYIVTVEPNSPAADSNIQPGDHVLAINGQLISSMSEKSIEMITQISNQAESLTLSLLPSDTLKLAGIFSTNYDNEHTSQENEDLENYLKLILNNNNIEITPVLSSNQNEYILTYTTNTPRHRKRRRHLKTSETQTSLIDDQASSSRRLIPSMGTSHVILRNSQSNLKDSRSNGTSEIKSTPSINNSGWSSYTPQAISPPRQQLTASPQLTEENLRSISEIVSNSSSSSIHDDDDLHEVHLHRSPNYPDFGFHLQYNRVYYIVHHIEHNSPAEHSGLRVGDVIRRVNNQTTDEMPHHILVEHIIHSKEVVFLVQTYEKFIRDNPEALLPPKKIVPDTKTKKVDWKYRNPLLRALSKLRSV